MSGSAQNIANANFVILYNSKLSSHNNTAAYERVLTTNNCFNQRSHTKISHTTTVKIEEQASRSQVNVI